ncbi:MAG: hypothetical protein NT154_43455, partial [Verrucomicrobia bacterium]|nr:hypothetical protein [Verrucomicrobiota bacterium]
MKHFNTTYVFNAAQLQGAELSDFLTQFDPAKLSATQLAGLCGALRLRIEAPGAAGDLFIDPQGRKFLRQFHARFPYAGYFFRLQPLRSRTPCPAWTDAALFVALGLCHTDVMEAHWDHLGCQIIRFQVQPFNAFLQGINFQIKELGRR